MTIVTYARRMSSVVLDDLSGSRVTLTFDNGPSETTAFVLDALAARGIHAWFCVVGRMVAAAGGADLVARSLAEGHGVINHSMTHLTPLGDEPTEAHAETEIVEAGMQLTRLVPGWDDDERWFRPFGRGGQLGQHVFSRPALDRFADGAYSVMIWNSVPRDWVDHDGWPEVARRQIADNARSANDTVLVLHDLPTGAMAHLERFLDDLLAAGVEFTMEPDATCVPVRHGAPTTDLTELTCPS